MTIATIKEAPSGLTVLRNGEALTLSEGDALRWGDELINESGRMAVVSIPAQSELQAATELTMDPGSKALLQEKDTPLGDGSSRTEVVALTDGIELYDVVVSTEVMGLVGPVGGAGLGALAGAGLLAAGLLAGAAASDDDNTTTTLENQEEGGNGGPIDFNNDGIPDDENAAELAMGNQDQDGDGIADRFDTDDDGDGVYDDDVSDDGTTLRGGEPGNFDGDALPDDVDTDDDNDGTPDRFETQPEPEGPQPAGLTGGLYTLGDSIEETPLSELVVLTDGVAAQTETLGETLEQNEGMDPSGTVVPLLSNTVGVADPDYNPDDSSGLVGVVDAVSEGVNSGLEEGQLEPLTAVTGPLLGGSVEAEEGSEGGDVAGVTGVVNEVGEILVASDTELAMLTQVTDPLAGGTEMVGSQIDGFSEMDPTGLSSLLANTVGVSDPDYNTDESSGLVGVLDATSEGVNTGVDETQLAPVSEELTDPLLGSSGESTNDGSVNEGTDEMASDSPLDMLTSSVPIGTGEFLQDDPLSNLDAL